MHLICALPLYRICAPIAVILVWFMYQTLYLVCQTPYKKPRKAACDLSIIWKAPSGLSMIWKAPSGLLMTCIVSVRLNTFSLPHIYHFNWILKYFHWLIYCPNKLGNSSMYCYIVLCSGVIPLIIEEWNFKNLSHIWPNWLQPNLLCEMQVILICCICNLILFIWRDDYVLNKKNLHSGKILCMMCNILCNEVFK